jgi:hypothetical protein
MLVATEAHLFDQPAPPWAEASREPRNAVANGALEIFLTKWREALRSGWDGEMSLAGVPEIAGDEAPLVSGLWRRSQ